MAQATDAPGSSEPSDASQPASPIAICTPTGRDASVTARVLQEEGFTPRLCADMHALCDAIRDEAGAVVLAEEALTGAGRAMLIEALERQPSWSDVPVVILTATGKLARRPSPAVGAVAARGNVTLLERPVRVATLVSTLRSALRARRRQLELRDYLDERERNEQSLRDSESRLRGAVLASPYPMMLHAEDGEVLQLSLAWSVLSGYPPGELRTTSAWTQRAFGDGAGAVDAEIRQSFDRPTDVRGLSVSDGEWTVRTSAGTSLVWEFHTVALGCLPDGRRLNLSAALDVTSYRRLIDSESRARQQAEEANKAKSDFLATMSHELRTPLNAIAGYAQLLALGIRGPVTDEQRSDLARIDRSQRHLLSLINDVLNLAKIEAGQVQFEVAPVPMRDLLQGLEAFVAPQLLAKRLRYVDAGVSSDAVVAGDEEKVRQIMINLLSNAIKFCPPEGEIAVACVAENGVVRTTVSDTGSGIPTDKLDAIFEPFVQVERDFKSTHEGTGLGLAISRDLARRMGGDLSATSVLGRGSVFTLRLPRA